MTFTTCTLVASFILFRGFNTTDAVNTLSLICGFLVIFSGVYLLNLSREDPDGYNSMASKYENGIPTDGIAGFETRRSMQLRRSSENLARRLSHNRSLSLTDQRLIHSYEAENGAFGLGDLAGDSDDEGGRARRKSRGSIEVRANGVHFVDDDEYSPPRRPSGDERR